MKTKLFATFVCVAIVGIFVMSCNRNKEFKEAVLLSSINSLGCGDSTVVVAKDYRYLLKKDTIMLQEILFTNVRYPFEDYIWRNSRGIYEVSLRNKEIRIKRFCDPEVDELSVIILMLMNLQQIN